MCVEPNGVQCVQVKLRATLPLIISSIWKEWPAGHLHAFVKCSLITDVASQSSFAVITELDHLLTDSSQYLVYD